MMNEYEKRQEIIRAEKTARMSETQLELFDLSEDSYNHVEHLVSKLPTKRQREYFRRFYIKAYKSAKDDGSIAWSAGNKQRYYANQQIREVLERRLALVFSRYDYGVSWLSFKGINHKQVKQTTAELSKPFFLLNTNELEKLSADLSNNLFSIQQDLHDDLMAKVDKEQDVKSQLIAILQTMYNETLLKVEAIGFDMPSSAVFKKKGELEPSKIQTALLKVTSESWWLKKLRTAQKRMIEHIAIATGEVRKGYSAYVSRRAFNEHRAQIRRNYNFLKESIVQNIQNEDEQLELFDMFLKSNANPSIRRIEMMTRLRGLEEWADEHGHQGLFITLTAPSKCHSQVSIGGKKANKSRLNTKYNGVSPRETQQYLNKVWQRARALFTKHNIGFYGMRVAEPHADATPHWHLLCYVNPTQRDEFVRLFRQVALAEDGTEAGADEHRLRVDDCDKEKGTATGYIVKYIAKNIDGFATDGEMSDEDPEVSMKDSAKRAVAWASIWGIRQFQLYGVPAVTAWRELRRLGNQQITTDEILEEMRICADVGEFAAYMQRNGGAMCKRTEQPAKIQYKDAGLSTYKEVMIKVEGLVNRFKLGSFVPTRLKEWVIKRKPKSIVLSEQESALTNSGHRPAWTCVNNCNPSKTRVLTDQLLDVAEIDAPLHYRERLAEKLINGERIKLDKTREIKLINHRITILENRASKENTRANGLASFRSRFLEDR